MKDLDQSKQYNLGILTETQRQGLLNWLIVNDKNWEGYTLGMFLLSTNHRGLEYNGHEWVFKAETKSAVCALELFGEVSDGVTNESRAGWYVDNTKEIPLWLIYIDDENERFYGFNCDGVWFSKDFKYPTIGDETKADREVVAARLRAEAVRRGFVEGATFQGVAGAHKDEREPIKHIGFHNEDSNNIGLHSGASWILHNGVWANVITEGTAKEVVYRVDAPSRKQELKTIIKAAKKELSQLTFKTGDLVVCDNGGYKTICTFSPELLDSKTVNVRKLNREEVKAYKDILNG